MARGYFFEYLPPKKIFKKNEKIQKIFLYFGNKVQKIGQKGPFLGQKLIFLFFEKKFFFFLEKSGTELSLK